MKLSRLPIERFPSRTWSPLAVLTGTLLLTAVAAFYVQKAIEARDRARFEHSVQEISSAIDGRLDTYVTLLRAATGLFAASKSVEPDEFHRFVTSLDIPRHYPGALGIGFTARIPRDQKEQLIATMRSRGYADFKIWPEGERSEYYAIIYLEPLGGRNQGAMGYDMSTEPVRRAAMEQARDMGLPTASSRVKLLQDIDGIQYAGFLVYAPVYRNGAQPVTVDERRESLIGFVYAPFRTDELLRGTLANVEYRGISFQIYDGEPLSTDALVYDSNEPSNPTARSRFVSQTRITIAARPWTLAFSSGPEIAPASSFNFALLTLIGGSLVSLLLFGLTTSQSRARVVSERAVRELKQSEKSLRKSLEEQKRAEKKLHDANQQAIVEYERLLERIASLAQAFGAARDLLPIYRALREFALISVPCDGLFVSLYDQVKDTRTASYGWGDGDELDVSDLPPMPVTADGPNSRAVRTGAVVITKDYMKTASGHPHVLVGPDNGLRPQSSLAVPMSVLGRVIGTIELQSYERAAYKEEHATAMRMAANLTAVAIENTQLLARESRARAEAEESNRLKDEFLATVSHELRTPLTAILGWARMMDLEKMNEATAARAIQTILRNAKSQAQIIDDILDVSRIVTGNLHLNLEPTELAPVIEAAINVVRPAAEVKSISIVTNFDAQPAVVSGDAHRLQQIAWNLLSNAVKFTAERGCVQVNVHEIDSHIEIEVSDNGRGISPAFLPYVFERFRQADSSTTRAYGGLGLGLAIVRHLVEIHGGTVRAQSEGEGNGSTFTVTLPLQKVTARDDRVAEKTLLPPKPLSLNGVRVLLVDDDPETLEMISTLLTEHDARVTAVGSVREALAAIEASRPDVLVSDIAMPNQDGYELIEKVRALETNGAKTIPAVAITAYAGEPDRLRALSAGFQSYLPKPFEPAELIAVVADLAERNGGTASSRD